MTITELTPIEILTEGISVPCDGEKAIHGTGPCDNPAAWILHMAACCDRAPKQVLSCSRCRGVFLAWNTCHCEYCGAHWEPASQAVVLIEPIGGAR